MDLKLGEKEELLKRSTEAQVKHAELRAANAGLKSEMDELDVRIKRLESAHGADCPLCGQPLSTEHRQSTLEQLINEGKAKGDQWRKNKTTQDELAQQIISFDARIVELASQETDRNQLASLISQFTERLENYKKAINDWELQGVNRLAEVTSLLENESYAELARSETGRNGPGFGGNGL